MAEGVVHRMVKRAVEMEGTVTGEHGVGLIKRDYLEHEVGETTVDTMRRVSLISPHHILHCCGTDVDIIIIISLQLHNMHDLTCVLQLKLALDPLCLLNCDKVVRVELPKPGEIKEW